MQAGLLDTATDSKGEAGPASELIRARLAEQVGEVERRETHVLEEDPEAIHKMRVALRRLRSALATFRPLFQRDQTDPLRAEMKWIAAVLGTVRDVQVTHQRFQEVLAAQSPELVIGPVKERMDEHMLQELSAAKQELSQAMASKRYAALSEAMRRLAEQPPWDEAAAQADDRFLRKRVRKDWGRLSRAVDSAVASEPERRSEGLHEVRKAAKRARYAAETVEATFGADAERFAAATKEIQGILGDHHDRVTELPRLRAMGIAAHLDGESAFTFGRLHCHEELDSLRLGQQFDAAWHRTSRKKLRRWLR